MARQSRVFTATYRGRCNECGEPVEIGDDVQFVDDELVHEDCNPELFD